MMESRDFEVKLEKMYGAYGRMAETLRNPGMHNVNSYVDSVQGSRTDLGLQNRADVINHHSIEGILAGKGRGDALLQRLEGMDIYKRIYVLRIVTVESPKIISTFILMYIIADIL